MQDDEIMRRSRVELDKVKPKISTLIKDTDHFRNDWGLDSLELVEFVARLEQTFQILIPDDDLQKLYSLSATVSYLRSKMAGS